MNQGKVEVVKQEMARVNIDILGISNLNGLEWVNLTQMTIISTPRRNGVAIVVNKSLKCSTWMQSQKRNIDLCLFPMQTIQYHSNPSLCPN